MCVCVCTYRTIDGSHLSKLLRTEVRTYTYSFSVWNKELGRLSIRNRLDRCLTQTPADVHEDIGSFRTVLEAYCPIVCSVMTKKKTDFSQTSVLGWFVRDN